MLVLGSSSMVTVLLCLIDLASSFPSYFVKPSVPLNEFIKHYEPAFYDIEEVTNQHRRIRRKAEIYETVNNANAPLKLTISTSNRVFKLLLTPDRSLFSEDVEFEGAKGRKIEYDPGTVYVGTLEDDERTKVRGIITKDGLFDGTITTQLEEFYVEPVSRYKSGAERDDVHTIVYKISDVIHPETSLCAISTSAKPVVHHANSIGGGDSKRRHRRRVKVADQPYHDDTFESALDEDDDRGWPEFRKLFLTQPRDAEKTRQSSLASARASVKPERIKAFDRGGGDGTFYDLDLVSHSSDLNLAKKKASGVFEEDGKRYEFNDDHQLNPLKPNHSIVIAPPETNGKHWRPKSGLIDTAYKYTNITTTKGTGSKGFLPPPAIVQIHKSNSKVLVGNGGGGGGGGGSEESYQNLIVDDSRRRIPVDAKKTTCMLYLQADHLFFEKYGTEETCIEVMTRHVQRVNSIYRNTDFNQDGHPDNISFMIKRIKVHSSRDPAYRFPGNYGVEKFLEIFSEEDYDAFCLAYMFTYRDFEMGTLGLAWTGDLKNAGGVCEKNGHYRGSLKSLNTGIVTVLNYGKHVPSAVSHVTLAHEIGHNFGSPHDPDGCTPGGDDGNFIMFARATSGDKRNNNRFSPCSLHAINPVLNAKARSAKGCFTEPQTSICGNGVVEPGEECDCGWEEDCSDICCFPQRRYPPLDETPCRLTPRALCSPSQGPCCSNVCVLKRGDTCRNDNGCRDSSACDGLSPRCPPSVNKPNKTVCNEEFVCYMGECTGSICLAYGLESCQCIPTPSDNPTKACELCCKLPGENQPCLSSFQWNEAPYDVPDMFAKPGTPCNDYNGYCDVFRKCREVDPSGPIATLRKLLLSEENIASFKKWALDHWYYCGLIFLSFLSLMILSTKVLGKKPKLKSVTVVHSSPTETVRLPADHGGGGGGLAVVVHPVAVRSKLPFRKKVRENERRGGGAKKSTSKEETVPHNVNNNNSPVEAKKKAKKAVDRKTTAKVTNAVVAAAKSKNASKSSKKETSATPAKAGENISDDPLGKVRNWLISSHNINGGCGSLKKSKSSSSSPAAAAAAAAADLDSSDPKKRAQRCAAGAGATLVDAGATTKANAINGGGATLTTPAKVETNKGGGGGGGSKKSKNNRVKLQVVYKPPFKFSVKLGKNKNEISSQLIRDKRPEAVKQRAALFARADRIRVNAAAANVVALPDADAKTTTTTTTTKCAKNAVKMKPNNDVDTDEKSKREECGKRCSTQPEPVYQNTTLIDIGGGGVREDERSSKEPQYANVLKEEAAKNASPPPPPPLFTNTSDVEIVRGRTRTSQQRNTNDGVKKRNSSNARSSSTRQQQQQQQVSMSKVVPSSARRRNSCDAGVLANKLVDVTAVRRQHSDESDVKISASKLSSKSTEAKRERERDRDRDRDQWHVSRVANQSKPVRLKCSYEMETSNLMTPSLATARSFKRKNSVTRGEENALPKRERRSSSNANRRLSNCGTLAKEENNEKVKSHPPQHVDLMRFPRTDEDDKSAANVPGTATSRESTAAAAAAAAATVEMSSCRQVDLTSEIPSDMEVLLCEGKNPT